MFIENINVIATNSISINYNFLLLDKKYLKIIPGTPRR